MLDNDDLIDTGNLNSDGVEATRFIRNLAAMCQSPFTDGFTQCTCKHRLYLLKCLIEDLYKNLPEFPEQEKEWEQERLITLLRKK